MTAYFFEDALEGTVILSQNRVTKNPPLHISHLLVYFVLWLLPSAKYPQNL